MKKIIYYVAFLLLLFLINSIPTSGPANTSSAILRDDLKIKEEFEKSFNELKYHDSSSKNFIDTSYQINDSLL